MAWNRLSPWVKRPLPFFIFAHFAHDMCISLLVPLLPFIKQYFGLSYFESGMLVSAYAVSSGLAQLPMGWLADRFGRRLLIATGLGGVGLATLTVGVTDGRLQVFLVFIALGLFAGSYHPSAISLLPRYFARERRGSVLGVHHVGGNLGLSAAPALGGLLADLLGWKPAFIALAIPALVAVPLLLRQVRGGETATEPATAGAVASPPSFVKIWQPIFLIVALAVSVQLLIGCAASFLPLYLVDKHSVAPAQAAMLLALVWGGGIIGSLAGGALADRWGRKQATLLGVVAAGPVLYLLTILPFGAALIVTLALLGLVIQLRQPGVQSLIVESVPVQRSSFMLGIYFFLGMEGKSLMMPVMGYLTDVFNIAQVFTIFALASLVVSALALLLRNKV